MFWGTGKTFKGLTKLRYAILNVQLYAHDVALIAETESDLQIGRQSSNNICKDFYITISSQKTIAFPGNGLVRPKTVVEGRMNHWTGWEFQLP